MSYPKECRQCLINPCSLDCPNLQKLQIYQKANKKVKNK